MKFRRKNTESTEQAAAPAAGESAPVEPAPVESGPAGRPSGPWDASEVDLEDEDKNRVDLGGLVVKGRPGLELRLQVDEASQQVAAVLLVGREGALELRPFAAPRNGGIWDDVRKKIAAETARRGGTATEKDGDFGTELHVVMPVKTPEGQNATQPSRVLGIEGPRWLLRATLLGRPAVEPDPEHELEQAMRDVVVVRGSSPMAPGEPLPLVMPSNARPVGGEDA
ncbi:MAG TPA: DUF3710 domain-containing protein [Nocardioidaceae bacterium]|nr:DUF3710 domain-containing protein [Nocardioidaceae bacterium]